MVKPTKQPTPGAQLIRDSEAFLNRYLSFPNAPEQYPFVLSLWAAATYIYPHLDAFPYLVITSETKRSGKSRLAELLSFMSSNPRSFTGMTPATLFRSINEETPTLFIDEAEALSSEAGGMMRSVLNVGYRKGQTVPRANAQGGITHYQTYCPKCFILIGDVFDTLRDRSIIIRMRRGDAPERFTFERAKTDGALLGERMQTLVEEGKRGALEYYEASEGLTYLPDRDAEIWMALFAVCNALDPDRMEELQRASVDLSMDKTAPVRKYLSMADAEADAEDHEFAERLLHDLHTVMQTNGAHVYTQDALDALKALPTGPWRRFRGEGLDALEMARLLDIFHVKPRLIKTGTKKTGKKVARGYRREDVAAAMKLLG